MEGRAVNLPSVYDVLRNVSRTAIDQPVRLFPNISVMLRGFHIASPPQFNSKAVASSVSSLHATGRTLPCNKKSLQVGGGPSPPIQRKIKPGPFDPGLHSTYCSDCLQLAVTLLDHHEGVEGIFGELHPEIALALEGDLIVIDLLEIRIDG